MEHLGFGKKDQNINYNFEQSYSMLALGILYEVLT